jgi:hypothetical protein
MTPYLDLSKTRRPGREVQRVNVDFPVDLLRAIDREARRIGVTRQAFITLREEADRFFMAVCHRGRHTARTI